MCALRESHSRPRVHSWCKASAAAVASCPRVSLRSNQANRFQSKRKFETIIRSLYSRNFNFDLPNHPFAVCYWVISFAPNQHGIQVDLTLAFSRLHNRDHRTIASLLLVLKDLVVHVRAFVHITGIVLLHLTLKVIIKDHETKFKLWFWIKKLTKL